LETEADVDTCLAKLKSELLVVSAPGKRRGCNYNDTLTC